jgi:hypothetical protein
MGVDLTPETLIPCPACAVICQVGVRTGGQLVINCPEHGVVVFAPGLRRSQENTLKMGPGERLRVLETSVRFFLINPEDEDFLVVQSMSLPCNYVQLRYNEATLWAEFCSRQWDCPYCGNRPLREENEIYLSELGFAGGGPHHNFESRSVPRRPEELARYIDRVVTTAFDEPTDFGIAIYPKRRETLRFILAAFAASASQSGV